VLCVWLDEYLSEYLHLTPIFSELIGEVLNMFRDRLSANHLLLLVTFASAIYPFLFFWHMADDTNGVIERLNRTLFNLIDIGQNYPTLFLLTFVIPILFFFTYLASCLMHVLVKEKTAATLYWSLLFQISIVAAGSYEIAAIHKMIVYIPITLCLIYLFKTETKTRSDEH